MLIDLNAWTTGDLQNFLHFLRYAEGQGVTDHRAISMAIESNLAQRRGDDRKLNQKARNGRTARRLPLRLNEHCPSCGKSAMVRMEVEGMTIDTCRACRWSSVVEPREKV